MIREIWKVPDGFLFAEVIYTIGLKAPSEYFQLPFSALVTVEGRRSRQQPNNLRELADAIRRDHPRHGTRNEVKEGVSAE
jgi:hypothetical protein